MANVLQGGVFTLDTTGIIATGPIAVFHARLVPNAAADVGILYWWDEANPIATTVQAGITATITGTNTFTATGLIPAAYAAGAVFRITKSNGNQANVNRFLIATVGNSDRLIIAAGLPVFGNEAGIVYSVTAYPTYPVISLKAQATNLLCDDIPFPGGRIFPNLALVSLTASAKITLYV